MKDFNKVHIKISNPNLYRKITAFGVFSILMGMNFFFFKPTFNPLGIDKAIIGTIFIILGVAHILFLNFFHNLRILRKTIAISIAWILFWGIGTTVTVFQGKTSFQLFILYTYVSVIQLFLLIEPYSNPVSEKMEEKK